MTDGSDVPSLVSADFAAFADRGDVRHDRCPKAKVFASLRT